VIASFPMVHESRVIRFPGTITTPRSRFVNAVHLGWDDSIFARIRQPLADFQAAMRATNVLVQDFAPAVFKTFELAKLLAAGKQAAGLHNATVTLYDRLSAMEFGSSNNRAKIIDTKEEYKRESVSVAGLPELLERLMLRLAAAAGFPVSLLMGQAPSGLNATGDSDIRWFYDHVAAFQEKVLRTILRRIYSLIMLAKDGPTGGKLPDNWDIVFRPLWQMTPAEIAKMRLDVANADALYVSNGILMPEEVARERFSGDTYSLETRIDPDERKTLMETQAEHEAAAAVAGREADPEGPAALGAAGAKKALEDPAPAPGDPAKKPPAKE
jgi:phage-related protein (TIGR01555 family)